MTAPHIITHEGQTYDLTALETPFFLLPEVVHGALKAWPHGWDMYRYGQWNKTHDPQFYESIAYRARPAPVETRVPCQRDLSSFRSDTEFGTCVKRADGSIDWTTWEPDE